jgi:type I restriction enzyme S subunit
MVDTPLVELGEFVDVTTGYPFASVHYSHDNSGIRLLRGDNIGQGRLRWAGVKRWPGDLSADYLEYELAENDVVLAMDRPWIEAGLKFSAVSRHDLPCLLVQRVARLRAKQGLDQGFLRWLIASAEFTNYLLGTQTGTAVPHISGDQIRRYRVTLPPLPEQHAIAEVLGALDDKIEANRRFARCCTELAICQGTDLLSSGEGRWVSLEQVTDVSKGVSYRSDDLVSGRGWLVSLKCVGRDGSFQPEGLKPFSGPAKDAQVVEEGDILVAQTDVTQRAEVIGRPVRVERLGFGGRFVASLDFVIVRPHQELTREVLLVLLSQREFRDHALGYCNGTTVLHMNSRAVPGYQFRLPDTDTATGISVVVQPLFARADVAHRETRIIAALRDALLPKLLSGELRVRDAESLVEDAV